MSLEMDFELKPVSVSLSLCPMDQAVVRSAASEALCLTVIALLPA